MDRIIELFKEERGGHFDPDLADAFLNNLDKFVEIKETYTDEPPPGFKGEFNCEGMLLRSAFMDSSIKQRLLLFSRI